MSNSVPPRKGVMAFETEWCYEDDDPFVILTFHHGLGEMTRLDLSTQDVRDLRRSLKAIIDER